MATAIVMDRDKRVAKWLSRVLKLEGITVRVCSSVEDFEGVLASRKDGYDLALVTTEASAPRELQFVAACRQAWPLTQVVLIVNGVLDISLAARAAALGADDFLEHPLAEERVRGCIRARLSTRDPLDEQPFVLVADPNHQRRLSIRRAIGSFDVEARFANTFEELQGSVRELGRSVELLAIADDLPYSSIVRSVAVGMYLERVAEWALRAPTWIIYSTAAPKLTPSQRRRTGLLRFPATDRELVGILSPLLGRFRSPLTQPEVQVQNDDVLREQLRSLDDTGRNLEIGKQIVAQLVSKFFDWQRVKVSRVAQGLSGARVFRITGDGEYILKLVDSGDRWKLGEETIRHAEVCEDAYFKMHVPEVVRAIWPSGDSVNIAASNDLKWNAICFHFIGGERYGLIMDLHTALTATAPPLLSRAKGGNAAFRRDCLDHFLSWLRDSWHQTAVRESRKAWDTGDRKGSEYPTYPPYQLTASNKKYTLKFLASEEAVQLGPGLFDGWDSHKERVWGFLSGTRYPSGLAGTLATVVSRAHGDLNSRNVFLWPGHPDHPFLIDLPMFQPHGHALQDFARLEAEIKFQLLDQQSGEDERRPPLCWNWSQVPVWRGLDDHLRSAAWEEDFAYSGEGRPENVGEAFGLIREVRRKARDVQRRDVEGPPSADFMTEYRIPLLFHTLLFTSYELPVFKRLFAVYSASEMLRHME